MPVFFSPFAANVVSVQLCTCCEELIDVFQFMRNSFVSPTARLHFTVNITKNDAFLVDVRGGV